MKFAAWYSIGVGGLMIGQWAFSIAAGAVPEFQSTPWAIGFHLAAEAVTALALIVSGIAALVSKPWGKQALLAALGAVIYSELNSPGYFAQQSQWALVAMFGLLLFGAVVGVMRLLQPVRQSL